MPVATRQSEGHYDVQEVPFGKVYKWRPGRAAKEPGRGELEILTAPSTGRRYDADSGNGAVHIAGRSDDEALHPWRYVGGSEDGGLPY